MRWTLNSYKWPPKKNALRNRQWTLNRYVKTTNDLRYVHQHSSSDYKRNAKSNITPILKWFIKAEKSHELLVTKSSLHITFRILTACDIINVQKLCEEEVTWLSSKSVALTGWRVTLIARCIQNRFIREIYCHNFYLVALVLTTHLDKIACNGPLFLLGLIPEKAIYFYIICISWIIYGTWKFVMSSLKRLLFL